MKSRRVRTLSTNIYATNPGTASRKAPVPSPAPPAKKRTFEVQTEPDAPADVVDIQAVNYDKKKLFKDFEDYSAEYFELVREQVLRHQALRTAITQVGAMTSKEFNNAFVGLDSETDEALSDVFRLNFLTSMVDNLNKHFHAGAPLDAFAVCQFLFAPQQPVIPSKPQKSAGFDSKVLVEQLKKLIQKDPNGPYGFNGNNSHDKPKS